MNILVCLSLILLANILLSPFILLAGLIYLVTFAAKCVVQIICSGDPTLELMPGNDAVFADPDKNLRYPNYGIIIFQMKGKIDKTKITKIFQNVFDDRYNYYVIRNCFRYIVERYGFYFWKAEENECIEDHYKFYDRALRSEQEVKDVISKLKTTNMVATKGQFFFSIYPVKFNERDEDKFFVMLTIHHSVADGFQALNCSKKYFAEGEYDQTTIMNLLRRISSVPKWKVYVLKLLALFYLPYDILLNLLAKEDTPFSVGNRKLAGKIYTSFTKPIDMKLVKGIKNALKTQANTLFLATLTQALRNTFRKHGMACTKGYRIMFPIALSHPEKDFLAIGNNVSSVHCSLPINSDNVPDSVRKIENQLNSWETKIRLFLGNILLTKSVNYLPMSLVQILSGIYKYSSIVSSFPICDYSDRFCGGEMLNMRYVIPYLNSGSSMTFGVAQNKLVMGIFVDRNLVSGQEVLDDITRNVELELENLASVLGIGTNNANTKS